MCEACKNIDCYSRFQFSFDKVYEPFLSFQSVSPKASICRFCMILRMFLNRGLGLHHPEIYGPTCSKAISTIFHSLLELSHSYNICSTVWIALQKVHLSLSCSFQFAKFLLHSSMLFNILKLNSAPVTTLKFLIFLV